MAPRTELLLSSLVFFVGLTGFVAATLDVVRISGLSIAAASLCLYPTLRFALSKTTLPANYVFALTLIPLVFLNYIYAIREGAPVGFQDVHYHIVESQLLLRNGTIDFSRGQTLAFNFVGLYILTWFSQSLSSMGVVELALLLPPLINLGLVVFLYLIVRNLAGPKPAMLSITWFGWENTTIVFGHEFRTQTLGTVFLFGILLLYLGQRAHGQPRSSPRTIASLVFMFALVTSSIVVVVFALLIFTVLLILPRALRLEKPLQTRGQFTLFVLFFFLYVAYISIPSSVFESIALLVTDVFSSPPVAAPSVGQEIYGPVVRLTTYAFWAFFLLSLPFVLRRAHHSNNSRLVVFLIAFTGALALGAVLSVVSPLSAARGYVLGEVSVATGIPLGFALFTERTKERNTKILQGLASVAVIVFVVASLGKFPGYIAGEILPLRGHEAIDDVPYWRASEQDWFAAAFLDEHRSGAVLSLHMLVQHFTLLELYDRGFVAGAESFDYHGRLLESRVRDCDLILLRDQYGGKPYAYRDLLPQTAAYWQFSIIYSSGDYLLFEREPCSG